jgi:hypothetical protein
MNTNWPSTAASLLLWSILLLGWVVAMYYVGRTASIWGRVHPIPAENWWFSSIAKVFVLFLLPFVLTGWRFLLSLSLAVVAALLALALTYARERGGKHDTWRARGAEFELGITGAYAVISALIVGDQALQPLVALLRVPVPDGRLAALCFTAALGLFVVRGGTQVVRGILNKAQTLPIVERQVDEVEYNRGRLIGSIERLLLAGMVAAGSYAALGFLVAAKGLVRSKDLERHDFAEYFLIGTLSSTALAVVAGGLVRLIFMTLW